MQVDIIIPTYKREVILREALESVRAQTFSNWICWVCEDGESEKTCNVIKDFIADKRFKYVPGEHFGAPARPRNRGIGEGKGELIAFLDDDDCWLPEKLENQVKFLENHPKCGILGTNAYRWDGNSNKFNESSIYFSSDKLFHGPIPFKNLLRCNYLIASSVIVKRQVLNDSGMFFESKTMKSGEDFELWLRVAAFSEAWLLDEPLVLYRETAPTTFYTTLNKEEDYKLKAAVYNNVLKRIMLNDIAQNSTLQENAALCRAERDYFARGPQFLGKLRYYFARMMAFNDEEE